MPNAKKETHEVFNILNHKENTNQNYTESLSYPSRNGYHQENKQQQIWTRMQGGEKGEEPYVLLVGL
jgi:hypothetical protein